MKHFLQVFSFDVFAKIILGVITLLIIRYMPQDQYAIYTLALSYISVVTQTLVTSFNSVYIIGYEKLNLNKNIIPLLWLQILLISIVIAVTIPFQNFGTMLAIIYLVAASTCISEFVKTLFQQRQEFLKFSTVEVVRTVFFLIGFVALLLIFKYEIKAWQIILIKGIALIIPAVFVLSKLYPTKGNYSFNDIFSIVRLILKMDYKYLFAYFFMLAIFAQVDIFMLKALGTEYMLASYGSAFNYYTLIGLALGAVSTVLFPAIQKAKSIEEITIVYSKYKKIILIFTPIVIIGGYLSQWIIPWIDNGKYPDAINLFRILCVSAIISFIFSPYANIIMRFEKFKFLSGLIIIALCANLILNSLLIPLLGAFGTAISSLISFSIINITMYIKAKKILKIELIIN